jgi:hypothetical protein
VGVGRGRVSHAWSLQDFVALFYASTPCGHCATLWSITFNFECGQHGVGCTVASSWALELCEGSFVSHLFAPDVGAMSRGQAWRHFLHTATTARRLRARGRRSHALGMLVVLVDACVGRLRLFTHVLFMLSFVKYFQGFRKDRHVTDL